MKKKDRQMNYELLRIIAMLMIVCLHYLSKGGALGDPKQELTTNGYLAWLIEAFCLVAVNVYVLISGYFGVDSQNFTIRRPLKIWRQVWFYSVGIGLIMLITGAASWNLYQGMTYVVPGCYRALLVCNGIFTVVSADAFSERRCRESGSEDLSVDSDRHVACIQCG